MSERLPAEAARPVEADSAVPFGAAVVAPSAAASFGGGTGVAVHEPHPLAQAQQRSRAGDHAGAAELYAAVVSRAPEDVGALLGLGHALLALGQYDAAERELRRALRLAPERADVHLELGVALHKRAVYPAAAAALRRTVELDPACAQAFLLLGETLNQLGEPADAIEALEQVVRLEPSSRAFYALGIAFDRKGQPERAAEMYRRSRELNGR